MFAKAGSTVVADRFDRTTFLGFLAAGFLVGARRLLVNEGITAVIVALEIVRRRLAAQVAINALVVHVIFSSHVLGIFICDISHKINLIGGKI